MTMIATMTILEGAIAISYAIILLLVWRVNVQQSHISHLEKEIADVRRDVQITVADCGNRHAATSRRLSVMERNRT